MFLPYYEFYELNHTAMAPLRAALQATRFACEAPLNPLARTGLARSVIAACEVAERATRRYGKNEFGLTQTRVGHRKVKVHEEIVWERDFCRLLHFRRALPDTHSPQPKILLVAPLSGHYATLLRDTADTFLPHGEVYITDWANARCVPLDKGRFGLDDYIDYMCAMIRHLGPDTHVIAVCQSSVPVLAATALMAEGRDGVQPASIVLIGGPIDTRVNPTSVNHLATGRSLEWFEQNVIMSVPVQHPGFMRKVYPGFLQLSGFMNMNMDRHLMAHHDFFLHLVEGDGDSAEKHREFYDEYLSVMDMTAEFYLETVDRVFIRHLLPRGLLRYRDAPVNTASITDTALMTIEGERDDISGPGQTKAAHGLCAHIPQSRRAHYLQKGVGHYGVFTGSRFRTLIAPRILEFIGHHRAA